MPLTAAAVLAGVILLGSWVFCLLTVAAARRYLADRDSPLPEPAAWPPISVLKPLHGVDEGLEANLVSFFEQDYPDFEIHFAARASNDGGLKLAREIASRYPGVPAYFHVSGEPPTPNAKAFSLRIMMAAARHELLVMADSDIRADRALLRGAASEFSDPAVGVATCPYRAVPGTGSFWSLLEAIGMNTEFWGGALTARLVEGGVHFAVGPTIIARRQAVEAAGGWAALGEFLAEDFVLGQAAARAGYRVILSRRTVEHRIGSQPWRANFRHRLRWCRSTRRSRPAGYLGQLFTYPLPLAILLALLWPAAWPALAVTALLRAAAAHAVSGWVLADPLCRRYWYLVPVQDILSFIFWIAGFFGNTIEWRGRRYLLLRDGRLQEARPPD